MIRYPETWRGLRAVLAHDWLTGMRGGERVIELLGDGFPDAPIATLVYSPEAVSARINAHPVIASPLQRLPAAHRVYRFFLPLLPWAAGRLRLPPCDLVLSTSHCVAKGFRAPPGAKHLCYCFTPMRYAWGFHAEYFGRNPAARLALAPLLGGLRRWDRRTAARVDRFVTLSEHVRDRIRRFYGREAEVVYPPVDTAFFTPGSPPPDAGSYDLIVSALVPYKRIDLAVRAYAGTGFPLRIVGVGSEMGRLRRLAGPSVEWLGWRSDEDIRTLYRGCRCLVFPGEEDFGIVPVEAQACGRPVVAYGRGGACESVVEGVSGVFFADQTEISLLAAVERCAAVEWDAEAIRRNAERFRVQAFVDGIARAVDATLNGAD